MIYLKVIQIMKFKILEINCGILLDYPCYFSDGLHAGNKFGSVLQGICVCLGEVNMSGTIFVVMYG